MPRNAAAANLVGVNTLERSGASTAHLFTTGTSLGVGAGCLLSGTSTSPSNTAFGHQALASLPTASAGFNTAVGYTALQTAAAAATRCTAVGYQALKANTTVDNTTVGYNAGAAVSTGTANTVIGSQAGPVMTTAVDNTCVGYNAGKVMTTGGTNTLVGTRAGAKLTNGTENTFVGADVGSEVTFGTTNTAIGRSIPLVGGATGTVVVGYTATAPADRGIAIGFGAVAAGVYSIAIGGSTVNAGNIGSVAIGVDSGGGSAAATVNNEFKFGTVNHLYNFPGQLNQPLNAGTKKITNLGTPTVGTDAATKAYADTKGSAITPNTGWAVTAGYTVDKAFDPESTTVTEVARALGTLIDALKAQNILGA